MLRPDIWFTTSWSTRQGEVVASIGGRTQHGRVLLSYRVQRGEDAWQEIDEPVGLT